MTTMLRRASLLALAAALAAAAPRADAQTRTAGFAIEQVMKPAIPYDLTAARKDLERCAQQPGVWHDLQENVGRSAEAAADDDDPEPVRIGATACEVHDRNRLQDDAVWIKESEHAR